MAFRNLSFTLAAGEVLVLRGPNGAGKTTLLRALAGLSPAASGRISLEGHAPGSDGHAEQVAYAGHLDGLKPQLTVAENLAFWADLLGGGRPGAALAALGLHRLADRPVHACSAGQKRRAGLARLLLAPRKLWLLDEPTVALDAEATAMVSGLIARQAAAGGMVIVATHVPLVASVARELVLGGPQAALSEGATDSADPFLAGRWS